MISVQVEEIFSSIQGEGPWVGQRHIFVRFSGCDIRCKYCDTRAAVGDGSGRERGGAGFCLVQGSPGSKEYEQAPRLLSPHQVTEFCSRLVIPGPSRPTLSLTGGEPLLHHEFLAAWLPAMRSGYSIYLETNGIRHEAMRELREMIDIVSMDFKLPSATGLRPFWDEHGKFLAAARGKTLFVKVVVTADTTRDDILTSANTIAAYDASVPLVIQPASGPLAPESSQLIYFQQAALGSLADVRVIPQTHKLLSLP